MLPYPCAIRCRMVCQQVLRCHHQSRRAKPALQRITIAKGGLQIGDPAAVGKSLDGLDRCAVRLHRENQAGTNDLTVHADRTCAANPMLAPDMRPGQLKMLPQEVCQIETRQNMRIDALTINIERYLGGGRHTGPPVLRSGPPRSANAQRAISTFARCRRMEADACCSS